MYKYIEIIQRLHDSYGRTMKEQQVTQWINNISKRFTPEILSQAVDMIINESDTFPQIATILKVCSSISPVKAEEKFFCKQCSSTGLISVLKKFKIDEDNYYEAYYTYRCGCKNGDRFIKFKPFDENSVEKINDVYVSISAEPNPFNKSVKNNKAGIADDALNNKFVKQLAEKFNIRSQDGSN